MPPSGKIYQNLTEFVPLYQLILTPISLNSPEFRRGSPLLGAARQLGRNHHRVLCLPGPETPTWLPAGHHGVRSRVLRAREFLRCKPHPARLRPRRHHLQTCHHLQNCRQERQGVSEKRVKLETDSLSIHPSSLSLLSQVWTSDAGEVVARPKTC